jgi:hypothetical protein
MNAKERRFISTTNWVVALDRQLPLIYADPLAAGDQTLIEKGDTAYCRDDINRPPILNEIHISNVFKSSALWELPWFHQV